MNWGHVGDCELSPRSRNHSYSAWCPSHSEALSFTHAHINPCVLLQRECRRHFNPLQEKHSSSLDVERQKLQKSTLWRWIREFVFISMSRIRFICYIQVKCVFSGTFEKFWGQDWWGEIKDTRLFHTTGSVSEASFTRLYEPCLR